MKLLDYIIEEDISDSEERIDFKTVKNQHSAVENASRWGVLLKGVGSVTPGKKYKPSEVASKIKQNILTKASRYANQKPLRVVKPKAQPNRRTGMNSFVDLMALYKQQFDD